MEKKNLIDSWDKLPLGVYKKIMALSPDEEDGNLKVAAILNGLTYEDILNQPLQDTKEMVAASSFLTKKPRVKLIKTKYRLGGVNYVFDVSPQKITTAQYLDINSIPKEDITSQLAVFLIPEGKAYNQGYDIEKVKEDIDKYLSAQEVASITDFFGILSRLFLRRAARRIKRLLRKARKEGVDTREAEKAMRELPSIFSTGS